MADGTVTPETLLAQYTAFIADVGSLGARYSTSQTFYMSVVSGLVAVITLAKDSLFSAHGALAAAAVFAFIALLCLAWWNTLAFYHNDFAAKLAVLKDMEQRGALYPIYQREWEELKKRAKEKNPNSDKPKELVNTERMVPLIVGVAAVIGAVAAIYFGTAS